MGTELTVEALLQPTGHICADCEKELTYTEEVFLLEVMHPQVIGGAVFYHHVIDEHDPYGGFQYEPFYYCFSCWENHYTELRDTTRDEPPVPDAFGAVECTCCGSSIREWELAGTFQLGELRVSRRAPNNVRGPRFEPLGKRDALCLYCLSIFNDNYVVMWDDLSQDGECCDCILARCWRHVACGCGCHLDEPDLDTDHGDSL